MTDAEARVWTELHRRVVASGKPVTRELVSKILDEMEEEYGVVRRKRDWRRDVGLGCLIVAGTLGATLVGYILWWK